MPAIKLIGFRGELPRAQPRLLPENAAQSAINCRLDDGSLTPIRRAKRIAASPAASPITIYKHADEWLAWESRVHAALGPVDDTRLYFTGDGAPKLLKGGVAYPLALPGPPAALTATLGGAGSGDTTTRVYVYTWVTALGEESEPNPASAPINWKPGNTVTLSGFAAVPSGRGISHQRIYRSQTGNTGTYLYLIAERVAAATDFVDNVAVDAFQEPLPSADWNPPPDDLAGLIALPNGMMAAFSGRRLYFSEPFRPHAWPEKYALTCDTRIVGLVSIDTSVIIMTEAHPYIAVGTSPSSMQMDRIESNWPCINAASIADLGFAACYATHEGLVSVLGNGVCQLISANLFSRDAWQRLSPGTMVASQLSGRYVAFYDAITAEGEFVAGSFALDIGETPFLVRTNIKARAAYFSVSEAALYYVPYDAAEIWRFDPPDGFVDQQYWRSKEFILPYPENFGAILVDAGPGASAAEQAAAEAHRADVLAANAVLIADGVQGEFSGTPINGLALNGDVLAAIPSGAVTATVGVLADGVRVASVSTTNRAVRLPGGFKARKWEIDVAGTLSLTNIVMGRTMDDITVTP